MKNTILLLLLCVSAISCRNKESENKEQRSLDSHVSAGQIETITVNVDGSDFDQTSKWLQTDRYVKLAPDPPLGEIKDIQIREGRIFIHDALARIVCFDMQGKLLWQIDARGAGPGEYTSIHDFAVNPEASEVMIYDNPALSLLFYDMKTGRFLRKEKLAKPNPTDIIFADGLYFYDSQYHNNYPNDTALHYSLLTSRDGLNIEQTFFKHDKSEAEYMVSNSPKKFYYCDSLLLYCKNFDHIVYRIGAEGIEARYQFNLPNPFPHSCIENKMKTSDRFKTDYSWGIFSIYECNDLLYFCYVKGNAIMVSLYDRKNKGMIYSGRRMLGDTPNLPIYWPIDGVYEGQFFSVMTEEAIAYGLKHAPSVFPDELRDYDPENDNPVIAFYNVLDPQVN